MNLLDEFVAITERMENTKIDYAICGGWALAIHGVPRLTRDIYLLIKPEEHPNVVELAARCGFDSEVESISLSQRDGTKCEIRRLNKFQAEDHVILDLILASESLESILVGKTNVGWNGRTLSVCSALGLAKMKWLAGRPQDILDIQTMGFGIDDPNLHA